MAKHTQQSQLLEQINLVIQRLERISADSIWARRASGHRGALLKWREWLEQQDVEEFAASHVEDLQRLQYVLDASYSMLENAAREKLRG